MSQLPFVLLNVGTDLQRWLSQSSLGDVNRRSSNPPAKEVLAERNRKHEPIKLDFSIPKKSRLGWIRRTLCHLPH